MSCLTGAYPRFVITEPSALNYCSFPKMRMCCKEESTHHVQPHNYVSVNILTAESRPTLNWLVQSVSILLSIQIKISLCEQKYVFIFLCVLLTGLASLLDDAASTSASGTGEARDDRDPSLMSTHHVYRDEQAHYEEKLNQFYRNTQILSTEKKLQISCGLY